MNIINFPKFAGLPVDIQRDIWQRAAYSIITTPSVQFLNLIRDRMDPSHEAELFDSTGLAVMEAAGPGWDQLPPALQELEHDAAWVTALRTYRASLVHLEPAMEDGTGLVEYGHSPCKQLRVLAATCSEAAEGVRRVMNEMGINPGALLNGIPTQDTNILAALLQPATVLCLANLWPQALNAWPIFSHRKYGAAWGSPERYKGQAVIIPCTLGFLTDSLSGSSWDSWVASSAAFSPSLCQACPELAGLRKVAFVYAAGQQDAIWLHPFCQRLGLGALWPENLPNLTDIYLIDKSISLLSDDCRRFLKATPSLMGCGATFYEVGPGDLDVWDITTANGYLLPVFDEAESLQKEYGAGSPVTVRVLACLPDAPHCSEGSSTSRIIS
jgi:hypothetical protein